MTREVANELEERRVIRLLAGATEAIPPLDEAEVETLIRTTAARSRMPSNRRRSFPRHPHLLSATAAAATVALAAMLPLGQPAPEQRSSPPPAAFQPLLIAFPDGSALSLLLSRQHGEQS